MSSRNKKPRLTAERHEEIARRLQMMHDELSHLSVEVANAYPRPGNGGKFSAGLHKAVDGLASAKCYGEDCLFEDCPDVAMIDTYYRHPNKCGDDCDREPPCSPIPGWECR